MVILCQEFRELRSLHVHFYIIFSSFLRVLLYFYFIFHGPIKYETVF